MDIAGELKNINDQLEKIWEVIQLFPNQVGFADNLDNKTKRFNKSTTKEEIRAHLINIWNREHPLHKINK